VHEPHGFAFLNAGALRKIDKRNSVMAPDLEGFFTLGFHGAHSGTKNKPSAYLPVAEDVPLGQFEVYFCTTKCLRAFFNRCVDELERRIAKMPANNAMYGDTYSAPLRALSSARNRGR